MQPIEPIIRLFPRLWKAKPPASGGIGKALYFFGSGEKVIISCLSLKSTLTNEAIEQKNKSTMKQRTLVPPFAVSSKMSNESYELGTPQPVRVKKRSLTPGWYTL